MTPATETGQEPAAPDANPVAEILTVLGAHTPDSQQRILELVVTQVALTAGSVGRAERVIVSLHKNVGDMVRRYWQKRLAAVKKPGRRTRAACLQVTVLGTRPWISSCCQGRVQVEPRASNPKARAQGGLLILLALERGWPALPSRARSLAAPLSPSSVQGAWFLATPGAPAMGARA